MENLNVSNHIEAKEEIGVDQTFRVEDLMAESGVTFGTSGARGLADQMTFLSAFTLEDTDIPAIFADGLPEDFPSYCVMGE